MALSKAKRVAKVIHKIMEQIRTADLAASKEIGVKYTDPLADCKIRIKEGERVTLQFDGAGYDYFSSEAWHNFEGQWFNVSEQYRATIEEGIKKIDSSLYIEDDNNWSFSVWIK
jgi:hypothetical protein